MSDFLKFEAARINRIEYLSLKLFIAGITITAILIAILASLLSKILGGIFFIFISLLIIFAIVYGILLTIKRLHDLNHNGWFVFLGIALSLIPIINTAWALYLLCVPGTKDENRFGEQPQPATLSHKITLFVCLLVLVLTIAGLIIFSVIMQPKDKSLRPKPSHWKTCATKNYTIKFPGTYKVTKKNIAEGLTVVNRSYINDVDRIKLDISEANYTKPKYEKFFNDSLTATPKKTIKNVLAIKDDPKNIKVTLDKSIHKYNLPSRELHAIIMLKHTYHFKSRIYFDKPNHKFYMLRAYYSQNGLQDTNGEIAKQFLNSFKLLSH